MATYIGMGLGSVYNSQILTFGALVTLMIGLFFGWKALVFNLAVERAVDAIEAGSSVRASRKADLAQKNNT
jgi:hypothetical protein